MQLQKNKTEKKPGDTTVWLASCCVRFQFQLCASAAREFWHKTILRGPAYTSTLILSHSLHLSPIHCIPLNRLSFTPSPSLHSLSVRARVPLPFPFHLSHSSVSYSVILNSGSLLSWSLPVWIVVSFHLSWLHPWSHADYWFNYNLTLLNLARHYANRATSNY